MVLAKAKLFDGLVDGEAGASKLMVGRVSKIGSKRVVERASCGVGGKKRVSPRRRKSCTVSFCVMY